MQMEDREGFSSERLKEGPQTEKRKSSYYYKQQTNFKKMDPVPELPEPRRKCGVTEIPDMEVVIGYNLYPESIQGGIPRILINADQLPAPETIRRNGLHGFENVNDCKRVIFRRVPGNNFFYELIKTNATHERIFLVCEPTEGSKILNLSGRNFKILFVGREGKELLAIRPCPNTKETVSVIYRQQELGRIIRHHGGDASAPTHTILDRELKKAFILRKKVHQVRTTQCCFHRKNKKLDDNSFNIFAVKNYGTKENTEEYTSVASICMVDAEIKFNCNEPSEAELGLLEKTLLFATLVSIKTKAMESAGIGFRISHAF